MMKSRSKSNPACRVIDELLSQMRPSDAEIKRLDDLEKRGDSEAYLKALRNLEKKYSLRKLSDIKIKKGVINPKAIIPCNGPQDSLVEVYGGPSSQLVTGDKRGIGSILCGWLNDCCDNVVPFKFTSLGAYDNMTGPNETDVVRGVLGAQRWYDGEYEVYNSGDTGGTTRISKIGHLSINFQGQIKKTGNYSLLMPTGYLDIFGTGYVHGHGNSSTCYDSKIWVTYYQILSSGLNLIEMTSSDIYYDGTRSEERSKYFRSTISLPARYRTVYATAGSTIDLELRCEVNTAANKDGKTRGTIDRFGFLANYKDEYDTVAVLIE